MSFFGLGFCLGDAGYRSGETIRSSAVASAALARQVAAGVIAIDNANRLIDNYRDQRDISNRTIEIARQQQNQLATVYWPREEQFLAEFSTPEPVEEVEVMGRRYAGRLVSAVAAAFAAQLREARCSMRRYCTSANKKLIQDLMMARGVAMANARVLGRNIAFAEYQARNDINLSRRMQAIGLGRGLIDQAMTLYQAAGRGFAAAGEALGAQLSTSLESFGYQRTVRANERAREAGGFANPAVMAGAYPTSGAQDAYMPDPNPSWNGQPLPGATMFGFQSGQQSFYDLSAGSVMDGDTTGLSQTSQPNVFKELQAEKMNDSKIGNNDLIRTGSFTFPVVGAGLGAVTVTMDAFPLKYADHLTEGYTWGM